MGTRPQLDNPSTCRASADINNRKYATKMTAFAVGWLPSYNRYDVGTLESHRLSAKVREKRQLARAMLPEIYLFVS